jgi:hypothetical protein
MQRERQRGPTRPRGRQQSAEGRSSAALALAELESRFARFRRTQPRGARVPEELRAAVVAAVGQGVRPGELQRACGVTWSQVVAWQARRAGDQGTSGSAGPTKVRVFSVVDEPREDRPEPPESMGERGLELRLGSWTVSVRLAGPGPLGRS